MMTLTYRQSMIRYKVVNGRKLYYADFTDVQKMFKRLRNRGLKFRYMVVSEYGGNNHRPHFHAIISVPKGSKDTYHDILNLEYKLSNIFIGEWRRNYGSDKKPKYKPLCQLIISHRGRTYDFHYINSGLSKDGEADVGFYVTKYCLKADEWVDRLKSALRLNLKDTEFTEIWKLLKPRITISKGFGNYNSPDVQQHIRKGIDLAIASESTYPFFINPVNGSTFPLARVYQKRFFTVDDKLKLFSNGDYEDGFSPTKPTDLNSPVVADEKLNNIRNIINSKLTSYHEISDEQFSNLSSEQMEVDTDIPTFVVDDWSSSAEADGFYN